MQRRNSQLAQKECISADLRGNPLIVINGELAEWLRHGIDTINIVLTYNLVYNASLMVDEGLGYALYIDKMLFNSICSSCFLIIVERTIFFFDIKSPPVIVWS